MTDVHGDEARRWEPAGPRSGGSGVEREAVYDVDVIEPGSVATCPVPLTREDFQRAVSRLARAMPLEAGPREEARRLLELGLEEEWRMIFNKVFYENKKIENERLELTDKGSLYFLGSKLTLSHCTLVLKVPARNLFIEGVQFIDCFFEVKQELKNHQQWVYASLKGCRFKGNLSGCDFGHWPDYSTGAENGAIEDCDFSEARLDGCRFMGCEPRTLRFPKWPCFTILNPIQNASELRRATWPGSFGEITVQGLDQQPRPTAAVTLFAPAMARRHETTPEALRAVIEKFDCIVY